MQFTMCAGGERARVDPVPSPEAGLKGREQVPKASKGRTEKADGKGDSVSGVAFAQGGVGDGDAQAPALLPLVQA